MEKITLYDFFDDDYDSIKKELNSVYLEIARLEKLLENKSTYEEIKDIELNLSIEKVKCEKYLSSLLSNQHKINW
jgi:hypothetical protein